MNLFETLTHLMMTAYLLFDRAKNPVIAMATTTERLTHALGQYSILPREIVKILTLAQARAVTEEWQSVVDDLARNLAEECGRDTYNKSHYQILVDGVAQDLGLDIRTIEAHEATQHFIASVYAGLNHKDARYALGVVYALECSAVPELRIVYELVSNLSTQTSQTIGEALQDFFDRHLAVWEPGHEAGLRLAAKKYLHSDAEYTSFRDGFLATIQAMENWWQGMADESALLSH